MQKKNIKHKNKLMETGWNKKLPLAEMLISRFDNYWDMKEPVCAIEPQSRLPDSSWS